MGFSISGSAAIIFIGFLVAAGLAIPTLTGTFADVSESQGEQIDRGVETLNTELEITAATYDETEDELTLEVQNTGSTSLSVSDTSLLVNDRLISDVQRDVLGADGTDLWMSADTLELVVENLEDDGIDTEELRVKVVAENGVDDVAVDSEIERVNDG